MWSWIRRDITPVGVEVDGSGVRLAQFEFRRGRPPTLKLLHRALPPGSQSADPSEHRARSIATLRRMLADGGFSGRRVVASVPDSLVHLRTIRLPVGQAPPIDEAVRREARPLLPFELEQLHLQYIEAGQTRYGLERRHEVIVAASRRDEVDRFLGEFDAAGLDVVGLDLGPCAAYRAARCAYADEREVHALLSLGAASSHVVIGKGSQVRFMKRIAVGTVLLGEVVSRRLGIDPEDAAQLRRRLAAGSGADSDRQSIRRAFAQACRPTLEALVGEVSACLRYYGVAFRGRPPARLLVSGAEAGDAQLATMLKSVVSTPVAIADPLAGFPLPAGRPEQNACEWTTALGLALKSASPAIVPAVPSTLHPETDSDSVAPAAIASAA